MRTVIALILLTAAAVGAGWWLQHLAGSLSLSIGTLQVQAPLSIAILVLIGVVLCVYVLLRLIATFLHLPGAFRSRGDRSRRVRGDAAVTNTLIALAAREPADARRQAARARRLLGDTPQTLLLSAYAGSIAGDEAEAEAAFEKLAERRDSAFLGLRGLLRQAVSRGDLPRAHELARQAEKAQPGASWLREERAHLAVRTGDWHDALQLTTEDAPRAALAAAAAEKENDFDTARKLAKQAWKKDPTLPAAAIAYARRLREGGREKSAQDVLRRSWTANPHPSLAAFALEPAADKLARLKTGTSLVSGAPDDVESHLLLGRLALEAGNPADAARHAQAARATGMDQRRLHMLQADIADADGNEAAQRDALRHAAAAGPDPSWRCTNCGATHDLWLPACPACHAIGKIAWVTAPKGLLAAPVRVRPGALPLDPRGGGGGPRPPFLCTLLSLWIWMGPLPGPTRWLNHCFGCWRPILWRS